MIVLALLTLALLCIIFFLGIVLYGRRNYGTLENNGFPVVPPTLFLGSDPKFYQEVPQLKDLERFKKYGPIWGLYMGATPQVLICDPELIRLILVKDSDYFYNRRELDFGSPLMNEILDYTQDEKWKTVRSMLSPLFTSAKLKTMAAVMTAHAEEYVVDLKRECGKNGRIKYNCKIRLTAWLIDMFVQSTLGIQLENRKDPNNKFAQAFRQLVGEDLVYGPMYSLSMTFPWLTSFAPAFDDTPTKLIGSAFRHIMEARRERHEKKATDFVDVLNDIMSKVESEEFRKLGITEMTVIAQAVNFLLGGYETSSTTLSHFFYFMAKNPTIQDKLYEEIVSNFGSIESKTTHDNIKEENTPYLTACLNESIRLGPPVKVERICGKNWTNGNIRIKKGTEVYVAMFPTQRNPEYFPDPDTYNPERFLPENKASVNPYAFAAFGHGPRNCIGMRFAYDSVKTFLIHFILHFKLELRPDTVLNYKKGSNLLLAFDPLYLDVVERTNRK